MYVYIYIYIYISVPSPSVSMSWTTLTSGRDDINNTRMPAAKPTLYYTVLYYTILYCTILYYTILYYTILYCTILQHTMEPLLQVDLPLRTTRAARSASGRSSADNKQH